MTEPRTKGRGTLPPTERLGLMTPSETDAYVAELKAERDALRERETLTLNQVGKLIGEVDALREALEEAADWLDNDLAHAPDTPVSMADRELIAHWRSVLDRTCPS